MNEAQLRSIVTPHKFVLPDNLDAGLQLKSDEKFDT